MEMGRVRGLMTELRDLGVMRLHLAGGEPTINKKGLANYLDTASALGLYTSMATNGMLFNEEICEIILRNHLKSVSFSLDGFDEQTNAAVRGPGVFAKTVSGIRLFKQSRDRAGSNTRICIKPTYDVDTPNEVLEGLVRLGLDLGVDVVKFANPERCVHHPQGHYGAHVDAYYEKIFFVQRLQETYGSQIAITGISNPVNGCGRIGLPGLEGCIGGQELLTINPNGKLTPCLMHPYDLGNVFSEFTSLRDFWTRSERLSGFWRALAKPAGCNDCSIYDSCRSGSTTRRVVEVGEFSADRTTGAFSHQKDPLCPVDYGKRNAHLKILPPTSQYAPGLGMDEVAVRHSL
jgi:radical SAM protein with 4Fe4S-binding SPASM domain